MGNEDGVHDTSRLLNNDESIATPSNGIDNVPASGIIYRRSWQSTLNFSWINPLLDWLRHPDAHLTNAHLPPLSLDLRPEVCAARLWQHLNKKHSENKSIQPTLLKSLARAYGRSYLLLGILKLFSDALNFAPALLLNRLLHYLDEDTGEKDTPKLTDLFYSWGFRYALLLKFSLALKAFLNAHYSYQLGLLVAKVRMAISSTVFNKTIDVKAAALASIGEGRVQTLTSVDADRIVGLCYCFHDVWSLPLQIIIALWLLYTQVQFAFLGGLAIIVLIIPLNKIVGNAIQAASIKMMNAKDGRVHTIMQILKGIRQIKACGWEYAFVKKVEIHREKELGALAVRKYLDCICVVLWATSSLLFSLFTFGLFALMGSQPLTAPIVFTSLALFNVLLLPINALPWIINGMIEAFVSLKRMDEFLNVSDQLLLKDSNTDESANIDAATRNSSSGLSAFESAAYIEDASFTWEIKPISPSLSDITFNIRPGSFVVITGSVGSGKSSLLAALLQEMQHYKGDFIIRGKLAYVSQEPWLMHGTVCENIVFNSENSFDADRYQKVLHACALQGELPDKKQVGDRGSRVSGGQRCRIALARALYLDRDVYLLDDVLAAVDAKVASWLARNVLVGGEFLEGKTVVIVSHSPVLRAHADAVIEMSQGRATFTVNTNKRQLLNDYVDSNDDENGNEVQDSSDEEDLLKTGNIIEASPTQEQQEEEEAREGGHVRWHVYRLYLNLQGFWVPLTLLSLTLMQATRNGNDLWLTYWVSHENKPPPPPSYSNGEWLVYLQPLRMFTIPRPLPSVHGIDADVQFYLTILVGIAAANTLFTVIRAFSFAKGGLVAAEKLHQRLLTSVLQLPVSFFDATPSGRILNRFSSDTSTADDSLPFIANIFLAQMFGLAGITIILCITEPLLLVAMLPMAILFRWLQIYYRNTSRELRRLESINKSPVYSIFSDALSGGMTIRAFDAQSDFLRKALNAIGAQQRVSITGLAASNWLSLRLQLMAATLAGAVGTLAVLQHMGFIGEITSTLGRQGISFGAASTGLVGLSLSYVLPITGMLSSLLTTQAETEQEMVAVERIAQYLDLSPQRDIKLVGENNSLNSSRSNGSRLEEPLLQNIVVPADNVPIHWPENGCVCLSHVSLRYTPTSPLALNDVVLTIPSGVRLGICGRTGAGKSSLVSCILQLHDIDSGVVTIDGVDIRTLPLTKLRAVVGLVPQTAFTFNGSIRENADPMNVYSDAAIVDALREVQLWSVLEGFYVTSQTQEPQSNNQQSNVIPISSPLDVQLGEGGSPLSDGQKQLLSIARIILQRPKIVILDECTSNVDPETSRVIREVLKRCLKGLTVIENAHNLDNLAEYDLVAVMEEGSVAEQGKPDELARQAGSVFGALLTKHKERNGSL